ncbi:hypothetical protein CPLU01_05416 [Colletotrichum plurivorum]|uniref:Uncharacterized protein n=1 Tax=Colletotrichum plurivorum TaxID=2175906 RepID=A0A8H6KLT2_9PEZI|nr:hypothetical protein CPLU01_05416 [Colletotrichum plurivorum]
MEPSSAGNTCDPGRPQKTPTCKLSDQGHPLRSVNQQPANDLGSSQPITKTSQPLQQCGGMQPLPAPIAPPDIWADSVSRPHETYMSLSRQNEIKVWAFEVAHASETFKDPETGGRYIPPIPFRDSARRGNCTDTGTGRAYVRPAPMPMWPDAPRGDWRDLNLGQAYMTPGRSPVWNDVQEAALRDMINPLMDDPSQAYTIVKLIWIWRNT